MTSKPHKRKREDVFAAICTAAHDPAALEVPAALVAPLIDSCCESQKESDEARECRVQAIQVGPTPLQYVPLPSSVCPRPPRVVLLQKSLVSYC